MLQLNESKCSDNSRCLVLIISLNRIDGKNLIYRFNPYNVKQGISQCPKPQNFIEMLGKVL